MALGVEPKELSEFLTKHLESYSRLLDGRFFQATIAAVAPAASPTRGYLCTVILPRESAASGQTFLCVNPGYFPRAGDVVECMWRDRNTGYVLWPLQGAPFTAPVKIAEAVSDGTLTQVSFANIPQTFRHLLIEAMGKSDGASASYEVSLQINGDTSALYSALSQDASNAAPTPAGFFAATQTSIPWVFLLSGTPVSGASGGSLFIPNYTSAGMGKMMHSTTGYGSATVAAVRSRWGFYQQVGAISSLLFAIAGANFVSGTVFTLYGLP